MELDIEIAPTSAFGLWEGSKTPIIGMFDAYRIKLVKQNVVFFLMRHDDKRISDCRAVFLNI